MKHAKRNVIVIFGVALFLLSIVTTPLNAEILEETGTLRGFLAGECETAAYDNWISHVAEGIADPGYNHYGPTWLDRQSDGFGTYTVIGNDVEGNIILGIWRDIFAAFLDADFETVDELLTSYQDIFYYELVRFQDTEFNRTYFILREQLDHHYIDEEDSPAPTDDIVGSFRRGWGIYIIDPESPRPQLNIQTPHPCDDFLGVQTVVELYLRLNAGTMSINGAGREVVWTHEGNYTNARSLSDPSRNPRTLYQEFTLAMNNKYDRLYPPGLMIFQIHSYDYTHNDKNPVILSAGQFETDIHKPLRDNAELRHDFIHQTVETPVPMNTFGTHPRVDIEDYFWLNYDNDNPFYYNYIDGGRVQIPRATSLRCDPDNQQENYLHSDYPHGAKIENFFHVEFCEYPDVLDDANIDWDRLYRNGAGIPTYEDFGPIFLFYEPFFQAVENWFAIFDDLPDDEAPPMVENFQLTDDTQPDYLEFSWDGLDDPNFAGYEILIDTLDVTEESTIIWNQNNDVSLREAGNNRSTRVTTIPKGRQWNVAVRAIDIAGNRGELSDQLQIFIEDEIGIVMQQATFSSFSILDLEARPPWAIVHVEDASDVDMIWVEWTAPGGIEGTFPLEPVTVSGAWGAPFDFGEFTPTVNQNIRWRVHARDLSQDGNPTVVPPQGFEQFRFTENPPFPFNNDFETNDGGMTSIGDWQYGTPEFGPVTAQSGENLWGTDLTGQYAPNSNFTLTLPELNLAGYGPLYLSWWQWHEYQRDEENRLYAKDGGLVQASFNDQTIQLPPVRGYHYWLNSPSNPRHGSKAFSGIQNWHPEAVSLLDLFGQTVELTFVSTSDLGVQMAGWYIDDIKIDVMVNEAPPQPFSLISPEQDTELPDLIGTFSWEESEDTDPNAEPPNYELVFTLNGDSATIFAGQSTSLVVDIENDVHGIGSRDDAVVTWFVYAVSQGDRTRSTQQRRIHLPPFNSIDEKTADSPQQFSLEALYPNPFNSSVTITYAVPKREMVTIEVFNMLGERVEILENRLRSPGSFTLHWNAKNYASGTYLVKMHSSSFNATKRIILLK